MDTTAIDIKRLFSLSAVKKGYENNRNALNEKLDNTNEAIKKLLEEESIKNFFNDKLQEGIDKFKLNSIKGKKKEQTNTVKCSSSTSNGESKSWQEEMTNPSGEFIPNQDKWEFISLDRNENGQFKLTIDNIKGRQYIGAFNWIPDYYYTDWFDLPTKF